MAWQCPCGGVLESAPFGAFLPEAELVGRAPTMWRYYEALPVPYDPSVSMGEGMSPLVQAPGLERAWLKLDFLMPTLSFKDRGAVVLATLAKYIGAQSLVVDSSGNAGTAMAAYGARAKVPCQVFVPESTPAGKITQMRAHGADVKVVDGDRQAATDVALARVATAPGCLYASHAYHPYFLQGTKTFAFEVWEQLGRRAPEWLVVPAGNGTLLLGAFRGFTELVAQGLAGKVPRLLAVQAERCAPLALAWARGASTPEPVSPSATVAQGIAIAKPPRGAQVLAAVRDSAGAIVAVGDTAVRAAHEDLAQMGVYVELTSAAAWAAAREAAAGGRLAGGEVVVALSGAGLKDAAP